jgi:hypothetical protein
MNLLLIFVGYFICRKKLYFTKSFFTGHPMCYVHILGIFFSTLIPTAGYILITTNDLLSYGK